MPTPSTPWIIPHVLPLGGALNIFGRAKSKKSFLALQLAEAVANPSRARWMPWPVLTHGPVVYIQLDTPRLIWQERTKLMQQKGQFDFTHVLFGDRECLPYPFDLLGVEAPQALAHDLHQLPRWPLIVIVDTLRESHVGDENSSGDMAKVINTLVKITHPAALVLLSHSRKEPTIPTQKLDLMSENRGSNYISGRMDCVMHVTKRAIHYQGRTVDETRFLVDFDETHHQLIVKDKTYASALEILETYPTWPRSQQARELMRRLGVGKNGEPLRTEESCRWLLRSLCFETARHSVPSGGPAPAPAVA